MPTRSLTSGASASGTSPCPASSCCATMVVVYCGSITLPSLLQGLFGYDALASGLVMSPAGVSCLAAMVVTGILLGRQVDARWLIAGGLVVMAAAYYWLARLNLQVSSWHFVWPWMLHGVGRGNAVCAGQCGRLQVHSCSSARGGGRAAEPASHRGWQRRHLDDQYHRGAARPVPLVPPGREPGPVEPPCPVFHGPGARALHAVDGRPGPVEADRPAGARQLAASSRLRRWPSSTSSGCVPSWRWHSSF